MALKISYGNGSLGDVTEVSTTINSYAKVTALNSTSITIADADKYSGSVDFAVGEKILLHVSASTGTSYKTYLGNWLLANITAIEDNVLTLDENPTSCIPSAELAKYYVQAITVAQYKNLTLSSGTAITPPIYSATNYHGGIVAIMCSDTLKFDGGHISLADRGIPVASKTLRPITNNDVQYDTYTYAGWENSDTRIHFMLNSGDGAAFIVAKKMICHNNSRIGNINTYGCQFYRGNSDSVTYGETAPSSVTNVGGSTIFIAAETIENFGHKMLAKYRSSSSTAGQGICRCYIASDTKLRNDEGLYAYDCISKPTRIAQMNIRNFGNGSFGDGNNITTRMNNYATITEIDGKKVSYKSATTDGLAQILSGSLVMIHFNHKDSTNVANAGRFFIANVVSSNGAILTLDATPPDISLKNYSAQIVAIPQFGNFTLSTTNASTPKFNGAQGGIFAIAVKGTCNLSSGIIDVRAKGGGAAYGRTGLAYIGNAQDSDKLPIGQGHGSIFILADKLTMNSATRIGTNYSGGKVHGFKSSMGGTQAGSGAAGGTYSSGRAGGYGGNGIMTSSYLENSQWYVHCQGAHVMLVADTITGFNVNAISTGGGGYSTDQTNYSGGAGYSSGNPNYPQPQYSAYNGGPASYNNSVSSSGSSGWAFVYCNNLVNPSTSGVILAN